jgi:hypothetical protein
VQLRFLAPTFQLLAHLGLVFDALESPLVDGNRLVDVPGVIDDSTEDRGCGRQLRPDLQRLAQRALRVSIVAKLVSGNPGAEQEQRVGRTRRQGLAEQPGGVVRVSGLERGPGGLSSLG